MTNHEAKTDIVVIGAGPGGYAAAFRAADLGRKVTLVDKNPELGGVCLNRGCIPSKALLHIAKVMGEAADLKKAGVEFPAPTVDIARVRAFKEKTVSQLNRGIAQMAKARGITVIRGTATFTTDHSLAIRGRENDSQDVSFDHAIIATGSRPALIPGLDMDLPGMMTSTGALELENIPRRLLVIGGGYIGLELGTVYQVLGADVTVVEFMPTLLPGADPDLVRPLQRRIKKALKTIYVTTKVTGIEKGKDGLAVTFTAGEASFQETFDAILVSVGRKPNTGKLGLDQAGIDVDERGFIPVNNKQQTAHPHIYAIGDVTGDPMLAHKATHEGKVVAEVIAGEPAAMDARAIPAVIFTDPEIAWAGLTETTAKAENIPYEKGEFPWAASGRSLAMGRNEGKTKILFDPDTRRVLGVGIVGPNAGDLIGEAALAIEMGADATDIALTIHPHPTLTETFANAAEAYEGTITDLYLPRKKK
ncbi:MAG: dihydrolipoyl dehydrogenase [Fidelibacterota bacterium]